jgi:alpha-beta hydrolase superfamily lysophospholipase/phosphatidylglycerophosphate synthase
MNELIVLDMPGTYALKPVVQRLLRPRAKALAKAGIRANEVTIFAVGLSVATGVTLLLSRDPRLFLLLPLVLMARMALNALDGILAREFGHESTLGVYLNELADVTSDIFLYLPFAHISGFSPFWVWNVVVLAVISEMAGVVAVMAGANRRYDGPMGKSDRALVFGALALYVGIAGGVPEWTGNLVPKLLLGLLAITIVNRVRGGLHETEKQTAELLPGSPAKTSVREAQQHTFAAADASPIFFRHWPAQTAGQSKAILLLHRGHEHSGRLQHLVDELNLPDFEIFAWDARGHGRTPGRRGYAHNVGTLVKDLDTFVREVIVPQGIRVEDLVVIGQSVGSVVAATWVHDYAPQIRCMVLAAPAFSIKLYVPLARPALRVLSKLFGDFTVKSYVKANWLTHDPERIASFRSDAFITRAISVRLLLDAHDTAARVVKDAAAIQTPTQILISGDDRIVRQQPQRDFFARLTSPVKELHELPGFYHDTLGEKDRHLAIAKVRGFLLSCFAQPSAQASLADADKRGPTKEEFERLSRPLTVIAPKAIAFGAVKLAIKTGGRLSDGIRIGLETGFDSGSSLDYVYRNRASGMTPLGKMIDRAYLNSIGWRGIRVRKQHLEQTIARAAAGLRINGMPVDIADIAAGHGRYVLDAVARDPASADRIVLRDYCDINVASGSALIVERGLQAVARFERGDAFDRRSLASIEPRPTLAIVAGLYELFPNNDQLRESLDGLAQAVRPSGYIIYTGQPWHPQLEFIARTLSSHRDRKFWIMRRRSQAELDQLVESAGFRKVDQLTDEWGIFTVSLAQRVAA